MDYQELLDEPEVQKVKIVQKLFLHSKGCSKKELRQELQLSAPTLLRLVNELATTIASEFSNSFELFDDEERLFLRRHDEKLVKEIIYRFIARSTKYRILLKLFWDKQFTYIELAEELALSESTLTRRIHHLNESLAQFQLKIENGQLLGAEAQIRYFYFLLLTQFIPAEELHAIVATETVEILMDGLEKNYRQPFTPDLRENVSAWLRISLLRQAQFPDRTIQCPDFLKEFLASSSNYQAFRRQTEFFSSIPEAAFLFANTDEHFYFYLMFFCLAPSQELISLLEFENLEFAQDNRLLLNTYYYTKTAIEQSFDCSELTQATMKEIHYFFEKTLLHMLCFEGYIFPYDNRFIENFIQEKTSDFTAEILQNYVKQVFDLWKKNDFARSHRIDLYFFIKLQTVFNYVDTITAKPINIGLNVNTTFFEGKMLIKFFENQLSGLIPLNIKIYQEQGSYDLIISDLLSENLFDDKSCYRLGMSTLLNDSDVSQLQEMIQKIDYQKRSAYKSLQQNHSTNFVL